MLSLRIPSVNLLCNKCYLHVLMTYCLRPQQNINFLANYLVGKDIIQRFTVNLQFTNSEISLFPNGVCLFRGNDGITRTICGICLRLTIE